ALVEGGGEGAVLERVGDAVTVCGELEVVGRVLVAGVDRAQRQGLLDGRGRVLGGRVVGGLLGGALCGVRGNGRLRGRAHAGDGARRLCGEPRPGARADEPERHDQAGGADQETVHGPTLAGAPRTDHKDPG